MSFVDSRGIWGDQEFTGWFAIVVGRAYRTAYLPCEYVIILPLVDRSHET